MLRSLTRRAALAASVLCLLTPRPATARDEALRELADLPGWAEPVARRADVPPGLPGIPGGPPGLPSLPTAPGQVPGDGGLGLLALACAAYAARRLRRTR